MTSEKLPETFQGFPTAALLKIWKDIPYNTPETPPTPVEEIGAMRDLLREYDLADFVGDDGHEDPQKVVRAKRFLAPFGIDAAPWADENGIYSEERVAAWREQRKAEEEGLPDYDADFYSEDEEEKA